MQPIQAMLWDTAKIRQYEEETGQALLTDEQTLVSFSQDFGKLIQSQPVAVSIPENIDILNTLILFANQHHLPITVRGNGLSQCGQSLPVPGGLTVSMHHFNKPLHLEGESIWVEANSSWASLLAVSLPAGMAPFVVPYNCNLSVAGVLSAGGVGAASFKYGAINAHVAALEVIDGLGVKHLVDSSSPLFHACLSGQGRCAVITKAQIKLRPVKPEVKTFYLVYADQQQWFADLAKIRDKVDYMELFCSPSIQGARLKGDARVPMAKWLYGMHISVEYAGKAPEFALLASQLKPWQVIAEQEEPIASYMLRHNSRFEMMKMLGQWELCHPWYECFVPAKVVQQQLEEVLNKVPVHYASLLHIAPVAKQKSGFLKLPDDDEVYSLMILHPGVPHPLKDSCLQAIQELDARFIPQGGKRYLSGFLGKELAENYWAMHFGDDHAEWEQMKKQFDPRGVFSSMLHRR